MWRRDPLSRTLLTGPSSGRMHALWDDVHGPADAVLRAPSRTRYICTRRIALVECNVAVGYSKSLVAPAHLGARKRLR